MRAKQKIRLAGIPYEMPDRDALAPRLRGVLAVIYLVFTEGYAATSGEDLMRPDLAREAIRLGRLLDALMPRRGEVKGLLALMLLHDARRAGRADRRRRHRAARRAGSQPVGPWPDRRRLEAGGRRVAAAGPAESYAVQAAIAALHARAPHYDDTDWPQIAGLYEVLLRISPSPVIELNHAAAISMVDGPARALDLIDALEARGGLNGYELLPAVRADLLRRLGRHEAAREAYHAATAATQLEPLRRLYARRLAGTRSSIGIVEIRCLLRRDRHGLVRQTRQQRLQGGQRRMIGDAVDPRGTEVTLESGDHFHGRGVIFAVGGTP